MVITLLATADSTTREQQPFSPFRPHTSANILSLIYQVIAVPEKTLSAMELQENLDPAMFILLQWGETISWCWATWDDSRIIDYEVIEYISILRSAKTGLYRTLRSSRILSLSPSTLDIISKCSWAASQLLGEGRQRQDLPIRQLGKELSCLYVLLPDGTKESEGIYVTQLSSSTWRQKLGLADYHDFRQLLRFLTLIWYSGISSCVHRKSVYSFLNALVNLLSSEPLAELCSTVLLEPLLTALTTLEALGLQADGNEKPWDEEVVWGVSLNALPDNVLLASPAVKWPHGEEQGKQDKWSRTYVTNSGKPPAYAPTSAQPSSSAKRVSRPAISTSVGSRVSAHIASATASRPLSPLKHSRLVSDESTAEQGILPSPHGSELAKVWGSVLQPKETLASFTCAICTTPFPPDATIYPDPSSAERFLCRPCFTVNGGSKGDCPSCHRPVLILKSEGGFVENGGRTWHKKCFCCEGCNKNIGDHPMVDLLGRPSCAECFDSCLKRPSRDSPKVKSPDGKTSALGGARRRESKTRDDSPALDELEQRLGIAKSRENTPLADRRNTVGTLSSDFFSTADRKESARMPGSNMYTNPSTARFRKDPSEDPFSYTSASSPYSSPSASFKNRYKSPEPDSSTSDSGSPGLGLGRRTQTRLKSPEPEDETDSPLARRTYTRTSNIGYDKDSPAMKSVRSPRSSISSPVAKPTEEAIEEMKKRFLTGSPATTPTKPSSNSSTPRRRRSKSRSRSRPRVSDVSTVSGGEVSTSRRESMTSTTPTATREMRKSTSTSSLRSALKTGCTRSDESALMPDRTGESLVPLRLRRDRTGDSQVNSSSLSLAEDLTGNTAYLTKYATGGATRAVRPQRTGDVVFGGSSLDMQRTGDTLQQQRTGGTDYTMLRSQVTGDTTYAELGVRRQKTGEGIGSQSTGYAMFPPTRPQAADEDEFGQGTVRQKQRGKVTAADALKLHAHRTGDQEVESLLGSLRKNGPEDLIDLSGSSVVSARSTGSMSEIPLPTTALDRASLSNRKSTRTSISDSSVSTDGYESSALSTPDLASDFSDTTSTRSSGPSTPPSLSPPMRGHKGSIGNNSYRPSSELYGRTGLAATPTPKSRTLPLGMGITIPEQVPKDARCEMCREALFGIKHGGKFVTVPEEPTSTGAAPRRYHTACFKCKVCGDVFEEKEGGHAVFVRVDEGACHVHCAPPERITLRKTPISTMPVFPRNPLTTSSTGTPVHTPSTAYYASSSRYERPLITAPATTTSFSVQQPRFGGSSACPGCHMSVSPMERGVVPGPQGTRWHAGCLVCGGPAAKGRRKEDSKAGCGKKLDSAAKLDAEGGVWCRECLLLLPTALRQPSPVRTPLIPTSTGTGTRPFPAVAPQYTGTTTIARQFTGLGFSGSSDPALFRQLTGGGLSPTKQLSSSPTKLHDGPRPGMGRVYPRPKSVTGTRSTGGEGRGMFLVRQLTGGKSFSGNEYGL
ncbi:hypothetical protein PHLCEN_2v5328 [Hermanssonia centrifuga]|uniref:LIM zinc-binding domain-containing protein n=1 Tax=Hermanssonia centrifuga TaxID=98765 RepID=A0A2R6P5I1_9APHY|nr:hypothetical protein PHLCEN_2v5328 [Hermanssonia centrifuga]